MIPVRTEWVRCLAQRPLDEAHTRAVQRQIEPNGQKQGEMRIGTGTEIRTLRGGRSNL